MTQLGKRSIEQIIVINNQVLIQSKNLQQQTQSELYVQPTVDESEVDLLDSVHKIGLVLSIH
ncbi:MAG: hypothetical protein RBR35_09260 [Salinivirgaceae bacterium]|nr:hypothetical protein [Salinivirgaceae bacterium]